MAAHRYWRITIRSNVNSIHSGVGELEMRESVGGVNVVSGGTPSAGSTLANYSVEAAFNGEKNAVGQNNGWASNGFIGSTGPFSFPWLQYDFGVGNEKDIIEIVIFCPGGAGITDGNMPVDFDWQWSDNGDDWNTQRSVSIDIESSPWALNSLKIFDVKPLGPIDIKNASILKKITNNPRPIMGRPGELIYNPRTTAGSATMNIMPFYFKSANGGEYKLTGTTTSLGSTVSRRVRLYAQIDGRLHDEQLTMRDGAFEFRNISIGPWTVVGVDDTGTQNGVIYSHVNAVPM